MDNKLNNSYDEEEKPITLVNNSNYKDDSNINFLKKEHNSNLHPFSRLNKFDFNDKKINTKKYYKEDNKSNANFNNKSHINEQENKNNNDLQRNEKNRKLSKKEKIVI